MYIAINLVITAVVTTVVIQLCYSCVTVSYPILGGNLSAIYMYIAIFMTICPVIP